MRAIAHAAQGQLDAAAGRLRLDPLPDNFRFAVHQPCIAVVFRSCPRCLGLPAPLRSTFRQITRSAPLRAAVGWIPCIPPWTGLLTAPRVSAPSSRSARQFAMDALQPAVEIAAKAAGVGEARASWLGGWDTAFGGLVIDNEGSTARDYLARERNFLASLKACVASALASSDLQLHHPARPRSCARSAHSPTGHRAGPARAVHPDLVVGAGARASRRRR